jgi:hypothetical protein
MQKSRFTQTEAQNKMGKTVRALCDLTDVPPGTPGQVNGWQEAERIGEYDVVVRFEPTLTESPVLKWLSKSDYANFIEEI